MHALKRNYYDYVVESYEEILELQLRYLQNHDKNQVFYRGQANSAWSLEPSILRNKDFSEHEMIQRTIGGSAIGMPMNSLFGYIAKMQHYELPTRFLDLTSKLDIALYFACSDSVSRNKDGHLFIFSYVSRPPSNADVIVLSELCLLQAEITVDNFSKRLIRKYSELSNIYSDLKELNMNITSFCDHGFVVLPEQRDYADLAVYNPRIQRQFGAFFVCGNKMQKPLTSWDRFKTHSGCNIILPEISPVPSTLWHHDWALSIIIPSSLKSSILLGLRKKGITRNYLFAEEKAISESPLESF